MNLLELPADVLGVILGFQDIATIVSLNYVCSVFRIATNTIMMNNGDEYILSDCCYKRYLDLMKWSRKLGYNWHDDYHFRFTNCYIAAKKQDYELLKCLYECGCEMDFQAVEMIAKHGNFKMVKWCVKNEYKLSSRIADIAASRGHHKIIKWIDHKHPDLLTDDVAYESAVEGHINILVSLERNGNNRFKSDYRVCKKAAKYGHIEYLFYAVDQGYFANETMIQRLISSELMLRYLDRNWDEDFLESTYGVIVNKSCYLKLVELGYNPRRQQKQCVDNLGYSS